MNWIIWIIAASLAGLSAVAIDAFGAHALKSQLSGDQWTVFNTAVRHHMFHTVALFAVGFLAGRIDSSILTASGCFFTLGILLFSGSLYAYAITSKRELAMITPVGGVTLMVGWILLAWAAIKAVT